MKNRTMRIAAYVLALLNLLMTAVLYPSLPDQIPMHWGIDGTVSYSDKYQIFLMCGMAVLFAVLLDVLPHIDPRKNNYQKFGSYYDGFCVFMQLFLLIVSGIVLTESFRPGTLSVPMAIMLLLGVLFLLLGNGMPKVKSNFYMGIKTPWTLSSEEVWRKTHRLGGKCFVIAGLVTIVCAFLPSEELSFWILMACIVIICAVLTVMSYVWWKQEQTS